MDNYAPDPRFADQTRGADPSMKRFYVKIPDDMGPGQRFPVSLDGVEFSVLCPQDVKPGDTIIVAAPRQSSGVAPPRISSATPAQAPDYSNQLSSAPPLAHAAAVTDTSDGGPVMAAAVIMDDNTESGIISCPACTFDNQFSSVSCEVCGAKLTSAAGTITKARNLDPASSVPSAPAPSPAPTVASWFCFGTPQRYLEDTSLDVIVPPKTAVPAPAVAAPATGSDTLWQISPSERTRMLELFYQFGGRPGAPLKSEAAFTAIQQLTELSPLAPHTLARLWVLADADRDEALSEVEWVAAMVMIRRLSEGHSLPSQLPESLRTLP